MYLGAEREHMTFQECYHQNSDVNSGLGVPDAAAIPVVGPANSEAIRATHAVEHPPPTEALDNPFMNVPGTIIPPIRKTKYTKNFTYYIAPLMAKCIQDGLGKEGSKKISVPRYQAYGWNMSGIHYLKPRSLASANTLIPEDRLWRLVDVYFTYLNPIFSPLAEGVFRHQLAKFYLQGETTPDDQTPETRLFNALSHVVCATAMRYLEVTEGEVFEESLEENLFDDAHKTVQGLSFEWQSLDLIQGWLLITFYLRMCHRQSSAWSALGHATRMCMGMYLFEDLQQDEEDLDPFDRQKQERVFWCAYTWDRILSLETGRPFSFRDDAITFERPTHYVNDSWLSITSYGLLRLAFCISLYAPSKGFRFERQIFDPEKKKVMLQALFDWNEEMKTIGLGFDDDLSRLPGVHPSTYAFLRQQFYSVTYIFNVETVLQFSSGGSIRYDGIGSTNGLLGAAHNLLKLSLIMKREKCLISPLWLTLSTLFNTGCVLICFANVGIDWVNLADNLGNVVSLVTDLQLTGKFIMADEILWGLKTLNHAAYLRLQRTQQIFRAVGIDHGSQAVNHGRFNRAVLSDQQTVSSPPPDLQKLMNPPNQNQVPISADSVLFGAAMNSVDMASRSSSTNTDADKEPPHNWFGSFNWDIDQPWMP